MNGQLISMSRQYICVTISVAVFLSICTHVLSYDHRPYIINILASRRNSNGYPQLEDILPRELFRANNYGDAAVISAFSADQLQSYVKRHNIGKRQYRPQPSESDEPMTFIERLFFNPDRQSMILDITKRLSNIFRNPTAVMDNFSLYNLADRLQKFFALFSRRSTSNQAENPDKDQ